MTFVVLGFCLNLWISDWSFGSATLAGLFGRQVFGMFEAAISRWFGQIVLACLV